MRNQQLAETSAETEYKMFQDNAINIEEPAEIATTSESEIITIISMPTTNNEESTENSSEGTLYYFLTMIVLKPW